MKIIDCKLVFKAGNKVESAHGFDNEWISLEVTEDKAETGRIYTVKLTAVQTLQPIRLEVVMDTELMGLCYHANGYQSWSESPLIDQLYYKKNLNRFIQKAVRLEWYGDYSFTEDERKNRWMHSHLFINLTEDGETKLFLGDLLPYDSYSWFTADYKENTITMTTDLEGISMDETDEITAVRMIETNSKDDFIRQSGFIKRKPEKITGWTSWYNYYTNISSEILEKNIDLLDKSKLPLDVFQIDDGYFTAVGDWLKPNAGFPDGMGPVAKKIRDKGWKPGIWLAPFVCEHESTIFKDKSNWILRDSKNRLQTAGWNPNWSGVFYPLDIYNTEFRDYLAEVFSTMKDDWGYSFFKLDFLYAACVIPRNGKTRAQVMTDALDLLNELTKGALLLTCGVPIAPAMGKCDYCRIGADISHGMEDHFLKSIGYRERVSTFSAISNTKTRAFLDGYAFGNDPDVFILRNTKEIKMSEAEKDILFRTNMDHSSLVFFSDDVSTYSEETLEKVKKAFEKHKGS